MSWASAVQAAGLIPLTFCALKANPTRASGVEDSGGAEERP